MSETVTIGGREFRIGATYAAKRDRSAQRTMLSCDADNWTLQPLVKYRPSRLGRGYEGISPRSWAKWAGEEVQP